MLKVVEKGSLKVAFFFVQANEDAWIERCQWGKSLGTSRW